MKIKEQKSVIDQSHVKLYINKIQELIFKKKQTTNANSLNFNTEMMQMTLNVDLVIVINHLPVIESNGPGHIYLILHLNQSLYVFTF